MSEYTATVTEAAPATVVVSEGISRTLTPNSPKAKRGPRPINVVALQAAIDRAEANGPLESLEALYAAVAADDVWNINMVSAPSVMKKIKVAGDAVHYKTVQGRKGRVAGTGPKAPKGKPDPIEPLTTELAQTLYERYVDFSNEDRLTTLLGKACDGSQAALRFLRKLAWLVESASPASTENAEVATATA